MNEPVEPKGAEENGATAIPEQPPDPPPPEEKVAPKEAGPQPRPTGWRRWAFAAVPAIGVLELMAHACQTRDVASEAEWAEARALVKGKIQAEDGLFFAPRWVEPIGRQALGDELATMDRMTAADETRYAHAIEVAIRGKHRPELAGWKMVGVEHAGRIAVTTYENPSPSPVVDTLLAIPKMRVSRVDSHGEQDCPLQHGAPQTSGTYYPPGVPLPGDRFGCAGAPVAITIMPVLDYSARRCVYAPVQSGSKIVVHFNPVKMGHALHGSHGLYAEAERDRAGAPVTMELRAGGRSLGTVTHRDGDGWRSFELDTSDLFGQTAEVVAEISSSGHDRQYCFEVTTR